MGIYNDYQTISTTVSDIDAINNAIRNILLTMKGGLPGKPTFGSQIGKLLFELTDVQIENLIYQYVVDAMSKWENRIIITNVNYLNQPLYNSMLITVYYTFIDNKFQASNQVSVSLNSLSA